MKAVKRFFYGREVFSTVQGVMVDGCELKVQKEVGCMAGFATVVIKRSGLLKMNSRIDGTQRAQYVHRRSDQHEHSNRVGES